jgi:hypothetical protein
LSPGTLLLVKFVEQTEAVMGGPCQPEELDTEEERPSLE